MFFSLKKIFGLFAAAALAATGLTCCGSGGGDGDELSVQSFCYKDFRFYNSDKMVGTMFVKVLDKRNERTANADIGFNENRYPYGGVFMVVGGTSENPVVNVHITDDPNDSFGQDAGAQNYFADFLPEEIKADDAIFGIPASKLTLFPESKEGGTYLATFTLKVDNEETEDTTDTKDIDITYGPYPYEVEQN